MNTEKQKKKTDLIKKSTRYKLVIPEEVERMIRHLCQKVPNIEWSGVLFYTHEGSFEKGDLTLTCRDIYVMDIGSSTYTEFNMSPEVIGYMAQKPELLDMQSGLIHSHQSFSCFFSGTDVATLKEEGNDRNHFLSLIVNNEGTYEAAVTRKIDSIKTITESYKYNSFDDEVKEGESTYTEEYEAIEYYMLDITKEGKDYSFRELDERLSEIRKRKEKEKNEKSKKVFLNTNTVKGYNRTTYGDWDTPPIPNIFDSFKGKEIPETIEITEDRMIIDRTPDKVNKDDVTSVLCQLITGSVVIRDYKSFNIDSYVKNEMVSIFDKRFGNNTVGFGDFEMWADQFWEFLIGNVEPENMTSHEEAQWMSDFSEAIISYLDSLESNKYIEKLKEITSQWIM